MPKLSVAQATVVSGALSSYRPLSASCTTQADHATVEGAVAPSRGVPRHCYTMNARCRASINYTVYLRCTGCRRQKKIHGPPAFIHRVVFFREDCECETYISGPRLIFFGDWHFCWICPRTEEEHRLPSPYYLYDELKGSLFTSEIEGRSEKSWWHIYTI